MELQEPLLRIRAAGSRCPLSDRRVILSDDRTGRAGPVRVQAVSVLCLEILGRKDHVRQTLATHHHRIDVLGLIDLEVEEDQIVLAA
jgi:hypothetical protein